LSGKRLESSHSLPLPQAPQVRPSRQSRPRGGEPDRLPRPAVDRIGSAPSGTKGGPVQAATECGHHMRRIIGGLSVEEANHGHPRLLRARRERPSSRTTAEKRDEFPPPHGAYPKAKDHELIIAPCIAAKSGHSCPLGVILGHYRTATAMSGTPRSAD